jgi:hypothetical protein
MYKIVSKIRPRKKIRVPKVEGRSEQQRGFIVILLMLILLLFVLTPTGCATVLALLTGTSVAVAP